MATNNMNTKKDHDKVGRKILNIVISMALSAGLILWLFHKVDFHRVMEVVRDGCDWRWLFLMMGIMVLSHVIRGIRWGMQLRGAGVPRLSVMTESVSIFGAYALNEIFTCLGEAWRCLYVSRITRSKLSTVVGTDLGDRASDAVVVVCLVALSFFVARPAMDNFLDKYDVGRKVVAALSDGTFWIWLAVGILALVGAGYLFRQTSFMLAVRKNIAMLWQGFAVIFHLKRLWLYILLTIGIWTCYFLETYVCFLAFPFTRHLMEDPGMAWGLVPGLVVFVFGSCSIAIPSSGGLGPWNIAVMFALSLYGIPQTEGAAYSLVVWAFQAATLMLLGVYSAAYVAWHRHHPYRELQQELTTKN